MIHGPVKVMVIDDEGISRRQLQLELEVHFPKVKITEFDTFAGAASHIRTSHYDDYDIIVSDEILEGPGRGHELLVAAAQSGYRARLVLATASSSVRSQIPVHLLRHPNFTFALKAPKDDERREGFVAVAQVLRRFAGELSCPLNTGAPCLANISRAPADDERPYVYLAHPGPTRATYEPAAAKAWLEWVLSTNGLAHVKVRATMANLPDNALDHIRESVMWASAVVADCTYLRPSVFVELGLALAYRIPYVMLQQETETENPFGTSPGGRIDYKSKSVINDGPTEHRLGLWLKERLAVATVVRKLTVIDPANPRKEV